MYYKHAKERRWRGPATVLGRDGHQFLLNHGSYYQQVHHCHLLPANKICNDHNNYFENNSSNSNCNTSVNENENKCSSVNDDEMPPNHDCDSDVLHSNNLSNVENEEIPVAHNNHFGAFNDNSNTITNNDSKNTTDTEGNASNQLATHSQSEMDENTSQKPHLKKDLHVRFKTNENDESSFQPN